MPEDTNMQMKKQEVAIQRVMERTRALLDQNMHT